MGARDRGLARLLDEIHIQIERTVDENPELVLDQAENLLEFLVPLFGD